MEPPKVFKDKSPHLYEGHVKHHINEDITDYYQIEELLGNGSFSEVRRGINRETGEHFAVKMMSKDGDERKFEIVNTELEILKRVGHKNVVKLYEVFESDTEMHFVLQLIAGGELFEKIVQLTCYTERDASKLIAQLIHGVNHLHSKKIIHRDLKPENILLSSSDEGADLLVTDFGLSALLDGSEPINRAVGTPGYLAPEVLVALDTGIPYDKEVDLFGIGVIMYILLCGFPPFYGEDEEEIYCKTETGDYSYPSPFWDEISDDAKNLIDGLLELDPKKRLNAQQALTHQWLQGNCPAEHLQEALENLKKFNARRKFKGAVHVVIGVDRFQSKFKKAAEQSVPPTTPLALRHISKIAASNRQRAATGDGLRRKRTITRGSSSTRYRPISVPSKSDLQPMPRSNTGTG